MPRAKQLIAIRIAPRVLAQLRRLAAKQNKPYQTLIHELLEKATSKRRRGRLDFLASWVPHPLRSFKGCGF